MTRSTSIEAYNKIKENGLLSKRRLEVYEYIFKYGPCTAREVNKALASQGTNSSSFIGRFSELRNSGVLLEIGKKLDSETGMNVILWDVTDSLPIKLKKVKKHKCEHCQGNGYITLSEETQND